MRNKTDPTVQLIPSILVSGGYYLASMWLAGGGIYDTYRTANFRGRRGKRKKQRMKQAAAPRLQQAKTSRRSHRLTVVARRNKDPDQQSFHARMVFGMHGGGGGNDCFMIITTTVYTSSVPTSDVATGDRHP